VRSALDHLPWVDGSKIEINYQMQVRLTIRDMKKFKAEEVTAALQKKIGPAKVLQVGKAEPKKDPKKGS
jgi:hypothetical protein